MSTAATIFARALALREAIYRIFRAIARGETPEPADLATVHREQVIALAQAGLLPADNGFDLVWNDDEIELDRVLWPEARSAEELLLTSDPSRVKQCLGPGNDCGWLFYDESKNGSRRWCSMEGCGSIAKMRRYRSRRRPIHA